MTHYKFKFDPKASSSFVSSEEGSTELVILLHASNVNSTSLDNIRARVKQDKPKADIWFPDIPTSYLSFTDPIRLVKYIIAQIDIIWEYHSPKNNVNFYDSITLIGHSIGALLARKIYVFCCGENDNDPFEEGITIEQPKDWASRVHRLILFAAMDRGWSVRDLSIANSLRTRIGVVLCDILMFFSQKKLLIFQVKKGASFITQLRIQWLAMANAFKEGKKNVGGALVIQLLGTVDDLVSPEDNVDLITGSDFFYLEVPKSSHSSVIKMDNSPEGQNRYEVFSCALLKTRNELRAMETTVYDAMHQSVNEDITDVIFVIHGIRDEGFWTQKIASRTTKNEVNSRSINFTKLSTQY